MSAIVFLAVLFTSHGPVAISTPVHDLKACWKLQTQFELTVLQYHDALDVQAVRSECIFATTEVQRPA